MIFNFWELYMTRAMNGLTWQGFCQTVKQWQDKGDLSKLSGFSQAWLSEPGQANWDRRYDMSPSSPYLTMELPVGVHVVWLVVKDGIEDSEPNEIIIELVGAIWVLGEIVVVSPSSPIPTAT